MPLNHFLPGMDIIFEGLFYLQHNQDFNNDQRRRSVF